MFLGDNLIAFTKNLSFLHDAPFTAAFKKNVEDKDEKFLIWRYYTQCWAAKRAMKLDGDFLECVCYRRTAAQVVADYVNFAGLDKQYYLYDMFDQESIPQDQQLPGHNPDLYKEVCERFAEMDNVYVT